MYKLQVSATFAAAHHLREYKGKCENMHGHNWNVIAIISSKELKTDGMVMDFGDFRKILNKIIKEFDHTYINEHEYFKKTNPTSENIACYIYKQLKNEIGLVDNDVTIESVSVEESKGSIATYIDD